MDYTTIESEFLRPLVHSCLNKIEQSATSKSRKQWKEAADECMQFFAYSGAAMWDPAYSKKFWKGVKLPRFRVTINKSFEMVAIYAPNLFWEIPHRTVEAKRPLDLPVEMVGEQFRAIQAQEEQRDQIITLLMDRWLNYTPREQPGGGLGGHSLRSVIDALIKGRGVLAPRPYQMPGSGRTLTGAFREAPENIFLDPDFDSVDECRWMAIRHVDVHRDVERRFRLPDGSLKKKATMESSWAYGEQSTDDQAAAHRKDGKTNDLVVWYEFFSKSGLGVTSTNMDPEIRDHIDAVVGQYAYVAVCADVPWPLNMPSDKIRQGAKDHEVKEAFSWPVPFWSDDRWPTEFLDFEHHPESAWPVPPMTPGMGELKLLNFLMSWFANRTWSSSRDFWAVAMPHLEHYREHLLSGDDQSIIPTPPGLKSPKEAVEILTQPESRQDMTQLINFLIEMFERRVGLTPGMYGQNEGGTQSRTAEETLSKQRALNVRPEFKQKQVVEWQSRVAQSEAFLTRWFITDQDVGSLLGPVGAQLWRQHVMSSDIELVVRQFQYTISAASIRRPNRERDIGNFQTVMGQFAPVLAEYGGNSGNFEPWNGMVQRWAELHDARVDAMLIPSQQPDPEQQALQQQAQQLELAEIQAKVGKLTAEAEKTALESKLKPIELQSQIQSQQGQQAMQMQMEQLKQQGEAMRQQYEQAKAQGELSAKEAERQWKMIEARLKLIQDAQEHAQEMEQDVEVHDQELLQKAEMAQLELATKVRENQVKLQAQREQAEAKTEAAEAQVEIQKKAAKAATKSDTVSGSKKPAKKPSNRKGTK